MPSTVSSPARSAFAESGLKASVKELVSEVADLYRSDEIPWIVGYSGGKDSSATLQLVWAALQSIPAGECHKPVHVISTDTLVENPVVAAWVEASLESMRESARDQGLPVQVHRLIPDVSDTFWVNMIGRGYPRPRPKFRWCTERLKIRPSNAFIRSIVHASGEAIVVLGTRRAESAVRAQSMKKRSDKRVRARLSPNATQPNTLIFSPIEEWSNDDVWIYLNQYDNPWGIRNRDLQALYRGASPDGECPLVLDTSTPSCGSSRFGCWVCTLVDSDKSMAAMIQNDADKDWLLPMLDLRDEMARPNKSLRDFRRTSGAVQFYKGAHVRGPYTRAGREHWLGRVLDVQETVRKLGSELVSNLELITVAELEEIRRIWVIEKHELEDSLPNLYEQHTSRPYPGRALHAGMAFGPEEMELLKQACGGETLRYELARGLLAVERSFRTKVRRVGLYEALEREIRRSFYKDEEDALDRAGRRAAALQAAQDGRYEQLSLIDPSTGDESGRSNEDIDPATRRGRE